MDGRVVFILAVLGIARGKLINSCNITKKFVDGHNERRLKLAKGGVSGQPAASKMTYLIWNEELANKARNWAAKNKYAHNPDTTSPSSKYKYEVGENIYIFTTTDKGFRFDPEMAMKSWWSEDGDYHFEKIAVRHFTSAKKILHYTQMAWAKTIHIGCGISQDYVTPWNSFLVVCNYGPAGNIVGETPYKIEKRASGRLVCGDNASNCSQKYGSKCQQRKLWKKVHSYNKVLRQKNWLL